MSRFPRIRLSVVLLIGLTLGACAGQSDLEVAEEFTDAFIAGDVDALAAMSTDVESIGSIPWRAEFLDALDLEVRSSTCAETGSVITCTIVGHNARTKLLAPDSEVKRSLHLSVDTGVVSSGSFEFGSPELAPIFDAFNSWAFVNRSDIVNGPCADIDGTSDPADCAAAVLEATMEYLAATDG